MQLEQQYYFNTILGSSKTDYHNFIKAVTKSNAMLKP